MQSTVAGIPCRIKVTKCHIQKPNNRADNPDDFYGYQDIEFSIFDRKGYSAPWLERKLTDADKMRIYTEILEYQNDCLG